MGTAIEQLLDDLVTAGVTPHPVRARSSPEVVRRYTPAVHEEIS